MMTYRKLYVLFLTLIFISLSVRVRGEGKQPIMVVYPNGMFTTQVVKIDTRFLEEQTNYSYLDWNKETGLKLPEGSGIPIPLAELIVIYDDTSLIIYDFYLVKYRSNEDFSKLATGIYSWIRYDTRWRPAEYNPVPQPHGDDRVRLYTEEMSQRILELLSTIEGDR